MTLEILEGPPVAPLMEKGLFLNLNGNQPGNGREEHRNVECSPATASDALAGFLEGDRVNRNDFCHCALQLQNDYAPVFAAYPSELAALLDELPESLPQVKQLILYLDDEFARNGIFFGVLRASRIFSRIEGNSDKAYLEVHLDGDRVRIFNIESDALLGLSLISSQPRPVLQNVIQCCKNIKKVCISSSFSCDFCRMVFSISTLTSLCLYELTLSTPAVATLAGALASPPNDGKKRKRDQSGVQSLLILDLDGVKIEKHADFLSLCRSLETNQSIYIFRIRKLTLLDSNQSTVGPLIRLLERNTSLEVMQSSGNTRFLHLGEHSDLEEVQQQGQLYAILTTRQFSLVSFSFGEWKNPLMSQIKDRLGVNYYELAYQMKSFAPWCSRYDLGRRLARATEKGEPIVVSNLVQKPCLLSSIFVLFQAHPSLIELIPEGSLD